MRSVEEPGLKDDPSGIYVVGPRWQEPAGARDRPQRLGTRLVGSAEALVGLQFDEDRAPGDLVAGGDMHRRHGPPNGAITGISIFIASRTTSGCVR